MKNGFGLKKLAKLNSNINGMDSGPFLYSL